MTISPGIEHRESVSKSTRVTISLDDTDFEKDRGPIQIGPDEVGWFGADFSPDEPGEYCVRIEVEADYGEEAGWPLTDDSGWIECFTVEDTTGELDVTVTDEHDDRTSGAAVVLYDEDWDEIEERQTDSAGDVSWSNLDEGIYRLEAYDDGEFWQSSSVDVTRGTTTEETLERSTPYQSRLTLVVDEEPIDGSMHLDETVTISPGIEHREPVSKSTRVTISLDDGEFEEERGPIQIDPDEVGWFGADFSPDEPGEYCVRVEVEADYGEEADWPLTDDSGWIECFTAASDGELEIDAERESGEPVSTVSGIVVYQDEWGEMITRNEGNPTIDLPHEVTNLPGGHEYLAEVYVQDMAVGDTGWIPIEAHEEVSETVTIPDEIPVEFDVTHADGETPMEGATIEIASHEGTVWADGTTNEAGTATISLQEPRDDLDDEYFEATVYYEGETVGEQIIEDPTDGSVAIETDYLGFSVDPESPIAGEPAMFMATDDASPTWSFGDGTTLTGTDVFHTYEESGTYDVTVSVDDETVTREVTVGAADFQVREIDREAGGVPLQNISYVETFEAEIVSENDIARVTFELGDESTVVESEDEIYRASFDLGELDQSEELVVTATDEHGAEVTNRDYVMVLEMKPWVEWMIHRGDIDVDERENRIDMKYDPFTLDYEFEVGDIPIDTETQAFDGAPSAEIGYDAAEQAAIVGGGGDIDASLFGYGFGLQTDVEGDINSDLEVVGARGSGDVTAETQVGPPLYVDVPAAGRAGVKTTVQPGLGVEGEMDEAFAFQGGTVSPRTELTIGTEGTIPRGSVGVQGTGGLEGTFDVGTDERNLTGSVYVEGEGWYHLSNLQGELAVGPYEQPLGDHDGDALVLTPATDDVEWDLPAKKGSQPLPGVPSVDDDVVGTTALENEFSPTADSATEYQRLTDRPVEDTQPAMAHTGNATAVVWSRQHEQRPVSDGRDIAIRIHEDDEWSDVEWITNESVHHEDPTVAATEDGELLVAWSVLTANFDDDEITDPEDAFPHHEIGYAVYDGEGWSEPTTLTDSDDREQRPSVTATDDGWLLAWEAHTDVHSTESDVRYTEIDVDSSHEPVERIQGAGYPAVGPYTNGDGGVLGYLLSEEASGGTTESVVLNRIAGMEAIEEQRFGATNVSSVETAENRVIWVENGTWQPTVNEGHFAGNASTLTLRDDVETVDEPSLVADGDRAVLSYRAKMEGETAQELVYRFDRGEGWIQDRQFVSAPDENSTVWLHDSEFVDGSERFNTVFAAKEQTADGKNDVFITEHEFYPAYQLKADTTDNATIGDTVTVEYTVWNRGDVPGSEEVDVTISDNSDTVATDSVGPLRANETATGSADVIVDEFGTFEIAIEDNEPRTVSTGGMESSDWSSDSTTVTAATPSLEVEEIEPSANETVTIAVSNDGGAVATDVPISVTDGSAHIVNASIDRIDVDDTSETELEIEPDALDQDVPDEVRLDPENTLDGAVSDDDRITTTWLYRPDLSVHDAVRYEEHPDGWYAVVVVTNDGLGSANATLEVSGTGEDIAADTELGRTEVALESATDETVYETVAVPIDETAGTEGDSVRVAVESPVPDADPSTTGFTDDVGPVENKTATMTVRVIDARDGDPVSDATVEVAKVDGQTGEDGYVELLVSADADTLLVDATGYAAVTESVDIEPGDEHHRTVEIEETGTYFDVEIDGTSDPVAEGETLAVDVTVTNSGGETDEQSVELYHENGTLLDTATVELAGGAETQLSLEWDTEVGQEGSHTLTVSSEDDAAEVAVDLVEASEDEDDDGGAVGPPAPPEPSEVVFTTVDVPTEIELGEVIEVEAHVENVGEETDSAVVTLIVDGEIERTVTEQLEEGDGDSVVLEQAAPDEPGEYDVTVETADDTHETTVTVFDPTEDEEETGEGAADEEEVYEEDVDDDEAVDDDESADDEEVDDGPDDEVPADDEPEDGLRDDIVPGFGLFTAIVSLVVVAALVHRRLQ